MTNAPFHQRQNAVTGSHDSLANIALRLTASSEHEPGCTERQQTAATRQLKGSNNFYGH